MDNVSNEAVGAGIGGIILGALMVIKKYLGVEKREEDRSTPNGLSHSVNNLAEILRVTNASQAEFREDIRNQFREFRLDVKNEFTDFKKEIRDDFRELKNGIK